MASGETIKVAIIGGVEEGEEVDGDVVQLGRVTAVPVIETHHEETVIDEE